MSDDFWDDEDLQVVNLVRLDKKGDSIDGIIRKLDKATFGGLLVDRRPARIVPQLVIVSDDDGEEWTLNAGATELKKKLVDARPAVGDHIHVEMTGETKLPARPGGDARYEKHFDVEITHASQR